MNPHLDSWLKENGLSLANDLIRLSITGSRGGGPVEQVSGYFRLDGTSLNDDLTVREGAIPLDLSALAGAGHTVSAKPQWPAAEYSAAMEAQDFTQANQILDAHKAALNAFQSQGGVKTVQDVIIDAALNYCYEYLKFSPVDVNDKFVVTRQDVVLNEDVRVLAGVQRKVFTLRLQSRFGA